MIFVLLVSLANKVEIYHVPHPEAEMLRNMAEALGLEVRLASSVEALMPELHKLEAREQ